MMILLWYLMQIILVASVSFITETTEDNPAVNFYSGYSLNNVGNFIATIIGIIIGTIVGYTEYFQKCSNNQMTR